MIKRCFDAAIIKEVTGFEIDEIINDHRNIIIMDGENIGLFVWRGPNIYEGHIEFKARGKEAIKIGKAMLAYIDAKMIWGLTPTDKKHVRWFNRKIGFISHGVNNTPEGERELFVLEK